eukprot:403046-Amphidinium_carterae.2
MVQFRSSTTLRVPHDDMSLEEPILFEVSAVNIIGEGPSSPSREAAVCTVPSAPNPVLVSSRWLQMAKLSTRYEQEGTHANWHFHNPRQSPLCMFDVCKDSTIQNQFVNHGSSNLFVQFLLRTAELTVLLGIKADCPCDLSCCRDMIH